MLNHMEQKQKNNTKQHNCTKHPSILSESSRDSKRLQWREPTYHAGPPGVLSHSSRHQQAGGNRTHGDDTHCTPPNGTHYFSLIFFLLLHFQGIGSKTSQSNECVSHHPKTAGPDSSNTCNPECRRKRNRKWREGNPS